ncbi:hypothetical protein DFH11DRAFT_711308 [Phellopilus nigrolimitatus]|nr:hypothetical protein DFH11DRAFT_711308 [Phellopilus nigrolimitatus]
MAFPPEAPPQQPPLPDVPAAHTRPPKLLAKGPYWARLPALRAAPTPSQPDDALGSGSGTSTIVNANGFGNISAKAPPIILPDRVGTTRVLLQDTQACVQKFSARSDALGARVEQALKQLELSRAALEAGNEKTVAELADVVYKCQAALAKGIETQGTTLEKAGEKIAHLASLYDAQTASLTSLTQTVHTHAGALQALQVQQTQTAHTHAGALQALQVQQTQLAAALAPLEPLVRAVPLHFDTHQNALIEKVVAALCPVVKVTVQDAMEKFVARIPTTLAPPVAVAGENIQQQQQPQPATGEKRKRAANDDPVPVASTRRRPSIAVTARIPSDSHSEDRAPTSPPTLRRRASLWTSGRLLSRGSMRRAPTETKTEAAKLSPETPTRSPVSSSPGLLLTGRALQPLFLSAPINDHAFTLPRTRTRTVSSATAHIAAFANPRTDTGADLNVVTDTNVGADVDMDGLSSDARVVQTHSALPSRGSHATVPARVTRASALANPPALVGPRQSMLISVDRPPADITRAGNPILDEGASGTTAVAKQAVDTEKGTGTSKSKSKGKGKSRAKPQAKAKTSVNDAEGAVGKGKSKSKSTSKGKGKKAAPVATTTAALLPVPDAMVTADTYASTSTDAGTGSKAKAKMSESKDPSPKRTTTGASNATETSAASEHGPPNSPLRASQCLPTTILTRERGRENQLGQDEAQHRPTSRDEQPIPAAKPGKSIEQQSASKMLRRKAHKSWMITTSSDGDEDERNWIAGSDSPLAAALAHVHSDIDFAGPSNPFSDAGARVVEETACGQDANNLDNDGDADIFGLSQVPDAYGNHTGSNAGPSRTSLRQPAGRAKRLLVVDNDSSGIDLWFDELLDE